MILVDLVITVLQVIVCSASQDILYPCSIKMREVLGNPSPIPRFPKTETRLRDISRVEVNAEGINPYLLRVGSELPFESQTFPVDRMGREMYISLLGSATEGI